MSVPKLISVGGPLFRKPSTTNKEFSESWHRHAQLVSPWFLNFGIEEYTQIHISETLITPPAENESAAEKTVRQADGIAIVRCRPIETADGSVKPFGDSHNHPYFANTIAPDERRFLHEESGATAVKNDPPIFHVPQLSIDEWRDLALRMGGVEHVKIQDGKAAVGGLWWDEWERSCKEKDH